MNDSAHAAKNFDPEANGKFEPETVSKDTAHTIGKGVLSLWLSAAITMHMCLLGCCLLVLSLSCL